ncbi:MAG TPA: magnesium chelatase domain-containing protein, partial [Candidatus Binatus sp.]|nr:magnesium chelatase domain-containing protein [Candidatus Binatus sp.]
EPGLDLPLALALASSFRDRAIAPGTVAVGEVGLLGELRAVTGLERRLREAARLGFERAIVAKPGRGGLPTIDGLELVAPATLRDAIRITLGLDAAGTSSSDRREAPERISTEARDARPVLG